MPFHTPLMDLARRPILAAQYRNSQSSDETELKPTSTIRQRRSSSVFQRLPTELQIAIFAHCLPVHPSLNPKDPPVLFCQVSRHWRNVTLVASQLWAYVRMDIPGPGAADVTENQNRLALLTLWLARSRQYPLSIQITHDPSGHLPDYRSAQLIAALIPHAHRWKNIHLVIPGRACELLQDFAPNKFPALKSVIIDMRGLGGHVESFNVLAPALPWGQLTVLDLHLDATCLLALDEFLTVLTQCVILSKCTFNANCAFNLSSRSPRKLSLPQLKHLCLTLQSPEENVTKTAESSVVSFLEQLQFSKLGTFRLDWLVKQDGDNDDRWAQVHTRFTSILADLSHSLQSFTLSYLPLSGAHLLDCLPHLRNVAHLQLRFSLADREHDPITDGFLTACAGGSEEAVPILPRLETIRLQCAGAGCTTAGIRQFILSRRSPGSANTRLKTLHFTSMSPVSTDSNEMSATWLKAGLDIMIDQVVVH